MIKRTTIISQAYADDFLVELKTFIKKGQEEGLEMEVQFAISPNGWYKALVIGREVKGFTYSLFGNPQDLTSICLKCGVDLSKCICDK